MIRPALIAALSLLAAAPALAQTAAPAAVAPATSEWRAVAPENLLVIDTTKGRILVELAPLAAPKHVDRIRLLAQRGFYDGIVWHRVIDWFMAQTGDPLGTGDGQSYYPDLEAEFTFRRDGTMPFVAVARPMGSEVGFLNSLPIQTQPDAAMALTGDGKVHGWGLYCPGVAGMARGDENNSANSQFFFMRQAYPALEKRYTVWGAVVSGLDVVRALKVGDGDNGAVTADPDRMVRVRVAADLPEAERPVVQMLDARSATFASLVEAARQARGADFSACDLQLPVQVSGAPAPSA